MMSRLNNGNGKGRSGGSSGTGGSSPTPTAVDPDPGLERALRRLFKKLPEGYSACIRKTGTIELVCTDHQLAQLQESSKARVFVLRKDGVLKATKVTPMNRESNENGQNEPAIARPRKPQSNNNGHAEMTVISRKTKRSKGLRF
jgi:hypothetical protein